MYQLGNVLYAILTGLQVGHNFNKEQMHQRLKQGITERLHERYFAARSPAEGALARIIRRCWTFDATRRPSIFEVVAALKGELRVISSRSGQGVDDTAASKRDDDGASSKEEADDSELKEDGGSSA